MSSNTICRDCNIELNDKGMTRGSTIMHCNKCQVVGNKENIKNNSIQKVFKPKNINIEKIKGGKKMIAKCTKCSKERGCGKARFDALVAKNGTASENIANIVCRGCKKEPTQE